MWKQYKWRIIFGCKWALKVYTHIKMDRSAMLITAFKVDFVPLWVVLVDGVWNFIGKQANGMNVKSERGGVDDKGPLPKAKRMSLKVASHAMKKEVVPPRWIDVR